MPTRLQPPFITSYNQIRSEFLDRICLFRQLSSASLAVPPATLHQSPFGQERNLKGALYIDAEAQ